MSPSMSHFSGEGILGKNFWFVFSGWAPREPETSDRPKKGREGTEAPRHRATRQAQAHSLARAHCLTHTHSGFQTHSPTRETQATQATQATRLRLRLRLGYGLCSGPSPGRSARSGGHLLSGCQAQRYAELAAGQVLAWSSGLACPRSWTAPPD